MWAIFEELILDRGIELPNPALVKPPGARLLGRSEPILGGALPIWGRLAISLNSSVAHWPKLGHERASPARLGPADRGQHATMALRPRSPTRAIKYIPRSMIGAQRTAWSGSGNDRLSRRRLRP